MYRVFGVCSVGNQGINCVRSYLGMLKVVQWPLKSFGNFAITSVGFIGLGFWGYSIYSEGKFNQPIIGESIKLLGKHPQIKELAGYPLSYSFSLGNRFVEKEGESYFSFSVRGPKSQTNVEMTASAVPASSVYNYGEKSERVQLLEGRIQELSDKLQKVQAQLAKTPAKKQKDLLLERANTTNQLKSFQDQLVEAKFEIIDKRRKYFVPSKELYSRVNDPRAKESPEVVSREELLWGINDLVITLPNRTKMIVYPEPKKTLQQKQQLVKREQWPDTPTVGLLNKKITIDISEFSKEEVEEYGKQKVSFMYSKYGSYRLFTMVLFFSALTALILYKRKSVLKSAKGSILEEEVKRIINRNDHVQAILRQKKRKELEFDSLIGGGITSNHFDCVMYLKNLTNGRLEFSGKYLEDINEYKYQRMVLKYRDRDVKKEIDLLK